MEISKKQYEYLLLAIVVALTIFRFSYYGLQYTPYLDDYTQYLYYPNLENCLQRVYLGGTGVLFTRPLAGLFDLCVWSRFQNNLGLAVGIISILHGLSAVFFYKGLNLCGIRVGAVFLAIFALLPINIEGTYWLSASSRIVVSMLFVALMLYFGAADRTALFGIFGFLSVWFYEQTAVLSLALGAWLCLRKKRWHMVVFPLIWAFLLGLFYLKFGFLGDNANRIAEAQAGAVLSNAAELIKEFVKVMTLILSKLLTGGFARGFGQAAMDFSLLWLAVLTVLVILFYVYSKKADRGASGKYDVAWGAVFMIAPLAPFFLLGGEGFNLRNTAPCIFGMAIVLDRALSFAPQRYICALAAVLVFWFSVAAVSELGDYNNTAKRDFAIAAEIAKEVNAETKSVKVKLSQPKYYTQNAPYRDHIMSMVGSDWGLTGLVRTLSKNQNVVVETVK